jgi:SAM-dependent methyltransferase
MARTARYDGLADAYDAFLEDKSRYYRAAEEALARLLGPGPGRCLDIGCGSGHFFRIPLELDWELVGVDESEDQLRIAAERFPDVDLLRADATALPFEDGSFDAAISTFTHTDFDDFRGATRETRRVLRSDGALVYVGNHPCFIGPVQEHRESGIPLLHSGYRRGGRHESAVVPGATPGGWRQTIGSFVHLPLGEFLESFSGLILERAEELDDGFEYPKTIALRFRKP